MSYAPGAPPEAVDGRDKCEHEWAEPDYICKKCGAVCTKSAPLWLWEHEGVKGGPRAVLFAIWTVADRNTSKPRPVYPGNKLLRRRSGHISASTLYTHLAELKRIGWIRLVDGDHTRDFELAWLTPFTKDGRTLPAQVSEDSDGLSENSEGGSEDSEVRIFGVGVRKLGQEVRKLGGEGPNIRTHTYDYQGTTDEHDQGTGCVRSTSGMPASATRPLDTRLPAMQPSVHTPNPPAESADHDHPNRNQHHRHPRGPEPSEPGQRGRSPEPRSQRTGAQPKSPGLDASGDRSLADPALDLPRGAVPPDAGVPHRGQRGPGMGRLDTGAGEAHRGARELRDRVGDGLAERDIKPDNHPDHVEDRVAPLPRCPESLVLFELKPDATDEPDDAVTAARVRAWWTSGYLPVRRRTYERWRPDARIVKIGCNDGRAKEIVRRLAESEYATWSEAEVALDHVVQCAAARVAASKAKVVPYGKGTYDTMGNISPTFWLKQTNFRSLLEDSLPVELPTRRPDVRHFELPDPCEFFE